MSVIIIANSNKIKMKKSYPILALPQVLLKNSPPTPQSFRNFILPFKKEVGDGRKLMCFHLKTSAILFNSFCVFFLEHIDIFWMFLNNNTEKNKR